MPLRVHMLGKPDSELLERLGELIVKGVSLTCGEDIPEPADYEILICGVPERRAIESSSKLRVLIVPWSGLPRSTRDLMREYPSVRVHNIHHNAVPAAEMAIALMMAAGKDLVPIDRALRQGDWSSRYGASNARVFAGSTALILGFGAIGKEIAARCLGLGMTLLAIRARETHGSDPNVKVYTSTRLHDLLPAADVLFLSLPMTSETKGLIGDRELSLLPDSAILVNIARGRIIDEDALYWHLKTGRIRAGLDVWYAYPKTVESRGDTTPSTHAFHELPNVVMTPHLAGHSDRTERLRARELARMLNLAAQGRQLPNRVDLEAGY